MNKILGFDFVRAFAIFFVFMAHILDKQSHSSVVLLVIRSISPGLTMSVLGFISAYLLTSKYKEFNSAFYVKRFSRIYSSLIICLSLITILHIFLSYDVINHHSIIHFMGLSFFLGLFQVTNISSLGAGLWFVTIIIIMYLFLPLITQIYKHRYKKIHLIAVILICLFFCKIMDGVTSALYVVIAFNIGCFVGINSNIEKFTKKSLAYYTLTTGFLLILSGLATSKILPVEIRGLLVPFYPFFAIPMLYKIGNSLNGFFKSGIIWFSSISYEVYILHFYFINDNFSDIFPTIKSSILQIIIAIIIVLTLACFVSKIGLNVGDLIKKYLFSQNGE